jgi:hypothetical protein
LLNNEHIWAVKIPFPDSIGPEKLKNRIVLAPNFQGENLYRRSKLTPELDWDMCENCNVKMCALIH